MNKNTIKKDICVTCGTQFAPGEVLSLLCPICNDDRQYINPNGQTWISAHELNKSHKVKITKINERLYSLKITPGFAIAQRAFLIISPGGNILWDCIPLVNTELIEFINSMGGLKAIAFSHPHYYSNMNNWAAIFDCPVYIHDFDGEWINYNSARIKLWDGDAKPLWDGIKIIHIGGHFPGSCVLHLPSANGSGTVFCGDTFYIAPSKRHIAVMHSYPNQILLTKDEFLAVFKRSAGLAFDALYGAFEQQNLTQNAHEIFTNSMKRYMDSYGK
jgi:glyoxylase-like metal-dependent hydrolase (beta-lactamase superfamily II)